MKIKTINGMPILDVNVHEGEGPNKGVEFGLIRDRQPDTDWTELRRSRMEGDRVVEIDVLDGKNHRLLDTLIEDLAYAYGSETPKFCGKLMEFKIRPSDLLVKLKSLAETNQQFEFMLRQKLIS